MNLKDWNERQIDEALSEYSRCYYVIVTGNPEPTDSELVMFYATHRADEFHQLEFDFMKEMDYE